MESIQKIPSEFTWYQEGRVRFLAPVFPATKVGEPVAPTKIPVFYNPFSKPSRDMTILLVSSFFSKEVTIAEPLAGSGVRGIRLLKETNKVSWAYLNDINIHAYNIIKINARENGVEDRVIASHQDAAAFLTRHSEPRTRFNYVDVDPVGSPARFLENSVRACEHEGVIGASATDLAALTGAKPKACLRKYDSNPIHSGFSKENAMRILLGFLARTCTRLNVGITPLLSFYHRHFIRVFAQIRRGRAWARSTLKNIGWITYCRKCMIIESRVFDNFPDKRCIACGGEKLISGPAWIGSLSDNRVVSAMLSRAGDYPEAARILSRIAEEETEIIGFYPVPELCRWVKISPPSPKNIIEKLREIGYAASITHVDPNAVKTDAPPDEIRRVLLELV